MDNRKTNPKQLIEQSFLEALRGVGSPTADIQPNITSGTLLPGIPVEISPSENRFRQLFFQERSLRQSEKVIRVRQTEDLRLNIDRVRTELGKLTSTHVQLEQQVNIAVFQPETPKSGIYHLNFFEQLLATVINLRRYMESATNWLAVFNRKSKKKNYYWGQVKKSGSRFYLSPDRTASNQLG